VILSCARIDANCKCADFDSMHCLKKRSFAWGSVICSSACCLKVSMVVSDDRRNLVMNVLFPIGVPSNRTPLVCSALMVSLSLSRWSIFCLSSDR